MQNIIKQIQDGDITGNNLLSALVQYENKIVDEFNEVFDALTERNTSLESQSYILEKQHLAIQKQDNDKKIFLKNEESLKKQSASFQLENQSLKHQIQVLKKDAKAAKEQTARNKASIKQRDAKIKRLEKQKTPDSSKLQPLTTIYCKGDDVLLIFPSLLELGVDGERKKQATLLYTDRKGTFVTCFLNNDNEASFSTPINDKAEISDQTRKLIEKNCIRISDDAADFAQSWLYRVNIQQGTTINPIDMMCID